MKTIHPIRPVWLCCLLLPCLLSACAGGVVVAGAAAGGAAVGADERSASTMVDDERIELEANRALGNDAELREQAHVSVTSFNRIVLLTGQAPDRRLKQRAVDLVRHVKGVRRVHDAITIGRPLPLKERLIDAGLTAKVKTALLSSKGFKATKIKVVTENRTVFLMGLTGHATGASMAAMVQQVEGVRKVVKVFEYTD